MRWIATVITLFVLLLLTGYAASAQTASPATAPSSQATATAAGPATAPASGRPRVLIVSIDGLRPDLALRCRMPHLRSLLETGSYSFWARTVPHAITLPSHVSMLTGVGPRKHKVEWTDDLPLREPVYPKFPTLFGLAKRAGYTTAMAAGKMKFSALCEPGTIDWQFFPNQYQCEDDDVMAAAVSMLRQHRPQVMAVHLPTVDNVGHEKGWGTREQTVAVERADENLGKLLAALAELGLREATHVILTADHGGAGMTHMADDPRARFIPWIVSGPGVRRGLDLTIYEKLVINTEDTFATASRLLNLPLDPRIDGKPISVILESPGELLRTE